MKWQLVYNGWLSLAIAIIASVIGTVYMKLSVGFRNLQPTILFIIFYIISFVAMTYALNYMQLSTLYAIWSGLGTLMVAIAGMIYFDESVTLRKGFFLLLIVIGVVGMHLS